MARPMRAHLEPAALNPGFPEGEEVAHTAWESEVEISKAISLKRIADAMEAQAKAIQSIEANHGAS